MKKCGNPEGVVRIPEQLPHFASEGRGTRV